MTEPIIVERLSDWSYGAFVSEKATTCIAIGGTADEALEKGIEVLAYRNRNKLDSMTANDMLDAVVRSLKSYPHGVDIRVKAEVDRIVHETARQVLDAVQNRLDEIKDELK